MSNRKEDDDLSSDSDDEVIFIKKRSPAPNTAKPVLQPAEQKTRTGVVDLISDTDEEEPAPVSDVRRLLSASDTAVNGNAIPSLEAKEENSASAAATVTQSRAKEPDGEAEYTFALLQDTPVIGAASVQQQNNAPTTADSFQEIGERNIFHRNAEAPVSEEPTGEYGKTMRYDLSVLQETKKFLEKRTIRIKYKSVNYTRTGIFAKRDIRDKTFLGFVAGNVIRTLKASTYNHEARSLVPYLPEMIPIGEEYSTYYSGKFSYHVDISNSDNFWKFAQKTMKPSKSNVAIDAITNGVAAYSWNHPDPFVWPLHEHHDMVSRIENENLVNQNAQGFITSETLPHNPHPEEEKNFTNDVDWIRVTANMNYESISIPRKDIESISQSTTLESMIKKITKLNEATFLDQLHTRDVQLLNTTQGRRAPLMFAFVARRDIKKGEEIILNPDENPGDEDEEEKKKEFTSYGTYWKSILLAWHRFYITHCKNWWNLATHTRTSKSEILSPEEFVEFLNNFTTFPKGYFQIIEQNFDVFKLNERNQVEKFKDKAETVFKLRFASLMNLSLSDKDVVALLSTVREIKGAKLIDNEVEAVRMIDENSQITNEIRSDPSELSPVLLDQLYPLEQSKRVVQLRNLKREIEQKKIDQFAVKEIYWKNLGKETGTVEDTKDETFVEGDHAISEHAAVDENADDDEVNDEEKEADTDIKLQPDCRFDESLETFLTRVLWTTGTEQEIPNYRRESEALAYFSPDKIRKALFEFQKIDPVTKFKNARTYIFKLDNDESLKKASAKGKAESKNEIETDAVLDAEFLQQYNSDYNMTFNNGFEPLTADDFEDQITEEKLKAKNNEKKENERKGFIQKQFGLYYLFESECELFLKFLNELFAGTLKNYNQFNDSISVMFRRVCHELHNTANGIVREACKQRMPASSIEGISPDNFFSELKNQQLRNDYLRLKELYSNLVTALDLVIRNKKLAFSDENKTFIRNAFNAAIQNVKVTPDLENFYDDLENVETIDDNAEDAEEGEESTASADDMSVSDQESADEDESDDTDDSNLSDSDFQGKDDPKSKRQRTQSHARFVRAVADFQKTLRALTGS